MTAGLAACALGPTGYGEGVALQERLVEARAAGWTGDWVLFPDHPPVLTVGRGAQGDGLIADPATLERLGVALHASSRGGDITWHGPGQLVAYPVCDLTRRGRDLHRFLRDLEQALIVTLGRFGIEAGRWPGRTGVWVAGEKIASIGIAVRRWVSYHGVALNVAPDLAGFGLIHPCGLRGIHMTSMAARLGEASPSLETVRRTFADVLAEQWGAGLAWRSRSALEAMLEAAGRDAAVRGIESPGRAGRPAHHLGESAC
jgi:lipoyl(octanoyl) transferase